MEQHIFKLSLIKGDITEDVSQWNNTDLSP
jgi:hypothetical protein